MKATADEVKMASSVAERLCKAMGSVIKGRQDTIRLVVTALIADGHVLLEDYPGSGKTTLTKTLGRLIEDDRQAELRLNGEHILPFRRIQFTPDMLPGDVLGVNVFDPNTGAFKFVFGPVFAHVLLADEINRTGPKVQAAFLECMAEKQVTVDNVTHRLDDLFFVVGTQNPLDIAGTYPLPLVQLDRFLFRIPMAYVDSRTEMEILASHEEIMEQSGTLSAVTTRSEVLEARNIVGKVHVSDAVRNAVVELVQRTRRNPQLQFGASTRAAIMLQRAMRAWALLEGRDFVSEDDLRIIAPYVLMHRLRFIGTRHEDEAFDELLRPVLETLISSGRYN